MKSHSKSHSPAAVRRRNLAALRLLQINERSGQEQLKRLEQRGAGDCEEALRLREASTVLEFG